MKTLLVISPTPELAETVRPAVEAEGFRVAYRTDPEAAELLLAHSLAQLCLLDAELSGVEGIWALEKLKRRAPSCPIIVASGARAPQWEEEAFLKGADHLIGKPIRPRLLTSLLQRICPGPSLDSPSSAAHVNPASRAEVRPESAGFRVPADTTPFSAGTTQTLGILRDFSAVLSHSLNSEAMLKEFLLLLRSILSINRAAVFVRHPSPEFASTPGLGGSQKLRCACAVGIPASLLRHVELSVEAGIASHLYRHGRILRRSSEEARADVEAQKEFELLGTQVAIPMLDRESLVGVALFDGRITGEALPNLELQLIFHLLEQVGLALKNTWLHDQLASNHQIMAEILRELSNACVVVSRELKVLHANKAARRLFLPADRRTGDFDFTDLPQGLGAKVYQVLKTGAAISNYRYEPEGAPGGLCSANVVPFHRETGGLPASALLMVEDLTQSEQLKRLEIETSNLRLVRNIAERLTNEIGNALVPLTVHQQMLDERLGSKQIDTEFLRIMDRDLRDSVRRVTRLTSQMRFLARDALVTEDAFPLSVLLEEAYEEARKHVGQKAPEWKFQPAIRPPTVKGDRSALKHAFLEILLNGMQANPADPKLAVEIRSEHPGNGNTGVLVEVRDNGGGFTNESLQKATSPFYTTRVVGIGLGLTVAQRIVEAHGGRLELPNATGQPGVIRISLPISRIQN